LPTAHVDPAAYDIYLKGLAAFNSYAPDSLARAPLLFRQAVARDPRFARPRAALAIAMVHDRNINGTFDEGEARRAVDEALSLDPADGEAQSADGVLLDLDWKWREAEEAHRRAAVLSPNNTLVRMGRSHHFGMLARYDEAIAEARRAVSLDPASDAAKGELFWASMHARRFDECVRLGRELGASWFVEFCEARLGRVSSVCAAGRDRPVCGYAHAVAGDAGEAARILRGSCASLARDLASTSHDVFEHYGTLCLQLSAAMGAPERMLEWTERLVQKHNFFCAYFHGPDTYDLLKDQPRFQAVLRQIGLPR
jgi:tetratricopeptide (TPR) repeat protein